MSCLDKLRKLESSVRRCPEFQPISFFLEFISWNFFRRFPRVTAAELRKHNDVCSICLGEMARARKTWSVVHMLLTSPPTSTHVFSFQSKLIVNCRCGHIFHPTCLAKALDVVNACPVCKQDIPTWPMKTWKIYVLFYKNYLDSLYMSSAAKSYSAKFCKIK